jgi:hypothetical protein
MDMVLLETSQLLKEYDSTDLGYGKVYDHPFNTFPKSVGFNNGLSAEPLIARRITARFLKFCKPSPFHGKLHLRGSV